MTVETVRGPIETTQLGVTLMHEHVFVLDSEVFNNYPEEWGDEDQRVAAAVARMNELKSRGVDTIVDLTVMGLGRFIPRIQRVAAQTQLNIIVATGIYTYNDLPFFFHFRGPGTVFGGPEVIADMFVRDIERGIADTGVKAAGRKIHHLVARGDLELNLRVGLTEGGDQRLEDQRHDRARHREAQQSGRPPAEVARRLACADQLVEGGLCP